VRRLTLAAAVACLLSGTVVSTKAAGPEQVATGGRLYRTHCASCHGTDARGGGPQAWLYSTPPPDLRIQALRLRDPDALVQRILGMADTPLVPSARALEASGARTEEVTRYLERLPRVDWPLTDRGRFSYLDRCEGCHGAFGHGVAPTSGEQRPPDLTAAALPADDAQLAVLVRHGKPGMPPLSGNFAAADVQALVAFVRLLSPGYEIYQTSCARCHGDRGGPPRGPGMPTVVFDRAYFAAHDSQAVRAKVWHMLAERPPTSMPHFQGLLSDTEARAIADYLRQLPSD